MRAILLVTTAVTMVPCTSYSQTVNSAPLAQKPMPAGPGEPSAPVQSTASESATGQAADQGLADIIVTAQRRAESSQRAAIAIDVVQGSDLIAAGVTQVTRLSQLAPALQVQPSPTGSIIFLRGVGNFTVSANSDPAIAFNYDGIYLARSSSTVGVFFDLDRVEVLKGPQGTLYGRNATGGAINVLPTQPKLGELSGYATATYGNYDAVTAEGAINLPLGPRGGLRVSSSVSDHNGYHRDGTDDDKTRSLRVQLKSELTPELTVRVSGDYSHQGGVGTIVNSVGDYVFNPVTQRYSLHPSGLPLSEGAYTPAAQAYRQTIQAGTAGRTLDALTPYPFQRNNFFGTNAEISYDTGVGTLTIVPAWRYASLNVLAAPAFGYRNREKDEQFSVEARFEGRRVGIFDYTLGFYYFDENIHTRSSLSLSSAVAFLDNRYKTKSYAPFGRITANLSDRLRVVGGARYTDDKKSFSGSTTNGAIVCLNFTPAPNCPNAPLFPLVDSPSQIPYFPPQGVPVVPLDFALTPVGPVPTLIVARTDRLDDNRIRNNRVTYRGAVEFDLFSHSLLYASYETGYRSGGFSPATGFETFQPEYITAWTVGFKNRLFDNRVQLNIEGFYWKYRDQQVNHVGLDLAGRTANFTQNIGRSTIKGFEVEARVLATKNTLLSFDAQYLDAKNKSFLYQQAVGAPGSPPPLTGCAVSVNANPALYDINCAGLASYNSPKWTMNLSGQQTVPVGDYKFVAGVDTQFRTKRNIGFQYLSEQTIGSSWTSNAQLLFGPGDERWSIAGYVRNIENNRVPVYSSLHPTAPILITGNSAPRTYGVRASVRF
ncbi:MAG: TonB-dependent receptor [Sphingomonadales bacterium]|nr:TonB-dependent receptor [Sphingomonadales bacterium]